MIAKIHYQDDCDELLKLADGRLNTLLEDGVKVASSSAFDPQTILANLPDNDHFLQHVIAMGDGETYGPNKNGDFWPKQANIKYHDTFVTNGTFFREHANRDARTQGIGIIKASAYNPEMARIELLVWGHKKKAEEEYQMAKEGKTLSYSMAARVPEDRCSICNNSAPTRHHYCSHLKQGMLKYFPEHEKYAYAINDDPKFFDISRVKNPADRIAHYIEFRFPGQKAASNFDAVISGADWAEYEGVQADSLDITKQASVTDPVKYKVLEKLAAEERWFADGGADAPSDKATFAKLAKDSWTTELSDKQLDVLRAVDMGSLFHKLASSKVLLPFPSFAAYVLNKTATEAAEDDTVKQACGMLPSLFKVMFNNPDSQGMESVCDAGSPLMNSYHGGGQGDLVQTVMDEIGEKLSIEPAPIQKRVMITVIKAAAVVDYRSDTPISMQAEGLARAYGHYKVSALTDMLRLHGSSFLDDARYLVATAQNQVYR